jgi:hypothetical protein
MSDDTPDLDALKIRQIIADIDQKRADTERKRQEISLAPLALLVSGMTAGAALFAAGAAFMKIIS